MDLFESDPCPPNDYFDVNNLQAVTSYKLDKPYKKKFIHMSNI